uniref:Thioredoxin domain-containing protein n=1 Tax=Sus scrofa TaxID=9823 RepID=A0A8D1WQE9_PIG
MAGKKRELQLQAVIDNQSLWDEMLQNKGLTVIDVYQAWCGPCKAMQTLFRKLKNELNEDEMLHFAVAEADSIVTLQSFRDKCEPLFLFSVNGKIIAKIKGANAPLVNQKVITLINEERKIAAGEMVRPQIINTQFVIEAEDKRLLTAEQVRYFYSQKADEPDFEDFVSFMTSGLSYILVISQKKEKEPPQDESEANSETEARETWDDQQEMAKCVGMKHKQDSLQEYMRRQHLSQFCDVEENITNTTLIDIFFPDFKIMKGIKLEKILALLRPDLFHEKKGKKNVVLRVHEQELISYTLEKMLILLFTMNHTFVDFVFSNSGPSLALVLLRDNCLMHWKQLIGPSTVEEAREHLPESLCIRFAMESSPINQLYGSDSLEAAEREIQHFFPPQHTVALIKPHVSPEQREDILKLIKEAGFDITQVKEVLLTEDQADKVYFKIKGKAFYKDVLEILSEGPSLVMILTKWNAVLDWRRLMGPTDPEEARLLSPNSVRAQYGRNILRNAVHGASNTLEAMETINKMFEGFLAENPEEN